MRLKRKKNLRKLISMKNENANVKRRNVRLKNGGRKLLKTKNGKSRKSLRSGKICLSLRKVEKQSLVKRKNSNNFRSFWKNS